MIKKINKDNYFLSTRCTFKACQRPNREPDYTSKSGSRYWYTDSGVYRESSHWSRIYGVSEHDLLFTSLRECSRVSSCFWILKIHDTTSERTTKCGFAQWDKFKYNNKRCGKKPECTL